MSQVTIKKIAEDLGLSRNTVSMAFNGDPKVAAETRQKIISYAFQINKNLFLNLHVLSPFSFHFYYIYSDASFVFNKMIIRYKLSYCNILISLL